MFRYIATLWILFFSCATWQKKPRIVVHKVSHSVSLVKADPRHNFSYFFYQAQGRQPLACWRRISPIDTAFARGIYTLRVQELLDSLSYPPSLYGDSSGWIGVPSFGIRNPNFVIIHHTAQPSALYTINFFLEKLMPVSAHYLIAHDGTIYPLVHEQFRAWHAGVARWGSVSDLNSVSIGIELDNNGQEEFPNAQIDSLIALLTVLKNKYKIPSSNFLGHADIAPGRKQDPSVLFPWKYLASKGFGLWYEDEKELKKTKLPANFDGWFALGLLGYDLSRPEVALQAFRRHFMANEKLSKTFSNLELKVLYSLAKKYLYNHD